MKRRTYSLSPAGCPVEATLDAIGGKYKGMILDHLLDGTKRFGELRKLMSAVTQPTMTLQLRELESVGVIHREVYPVVPPKVEYSLTEKGRTLEPILRLMQEWGKNHLGQIEQLTPKSSFLGNSSLVRGKVHSMNAEEILPMAMTEVRPIDPPRVRLEFLDGIRGLAALYVVYYHAAWMYPQSGDLVRGIGPILKLMAFGHYAVVIFIVLSGFCLMLPVVRTKDGRLRGGFGAYLRRRAWRILPPYYASVAFSWLMVTLRNSIHQQSFQPPSTSILVSHLVLFQNLKEGWVNGLNLPLWSVATEWQIYFVFPALLVVWRRAGLLAAVGAGFALGYAATYQGWFPAGCPWMVAAFTLGMAGAALSFPNHLVHLARIERIPWGAVAILGATAAAVVYAIRPKLTSFPTEALVDPLVAIATTGFLIRSARRLIDGQGPGSPVLRLLESRGLTELGNFSFSLYLIHLVVLDSIYYNMIHFQGNPSRAWATVFLAGPPCCLVLAYLFHRAFERRFMTHRGREITTRS